MPKGLRNIENRQIPIKRNHIKFINNFDIEVKYTIRFELEINWKSFLLKLYDWRFDTAEASLIMYAWR